VDTVAAFDGPAGLDFAAAQSPDLILLDVDMPGSTASKFAAV